MYIVETECFENLGRGHADQTRWILSNASVGSWLSRHMSIGSHPESGRRGRGWQPIGYEQAIFRRKTPIVARNLVSAPTRRKMEDHLLSCEPTGLTALTSASVSLKSLTETCPQHRGWGNVQF